MIHRRAPKRNPAAPDTHEARRELQRDAEFLMVAAGAFNKKNARRKNDLRRARVLGIYSIIGKSSHWYSLCRCLGLSSTRTSDYKQMFPNILNLLLR